MNQRELCDFVRLKIRDVASPQFFSDDEIAANLNEAQNEACSRALLIEDNENVTVSINTTDVRYEIEPRIIDAIDISLDGKEFLGWTLTETHLVLDQVPSAEGTLILHCYLYPEEMQDENDKPTIREAYHRQMCYWAISLCFLTPDADLFNQDAGDRYASLFTQCFGERTSATTRRNQRSKPPKVVSYNGAI